MVFLTHSASRSELLNRDCRLHLAPATVKHSMSLATPRVGQRASIPQSEPPQGTSRGLTVGHYSPGFSTRPTNRMASVARSRIRKIKGRSTIILIGSGLPYTTFSVITLVAAAASVPSSSTDTNAL